MRTFLAIALLSTTLPMWAGSYTLQVHAPAHVGARVLLYRHADLLTPRMVRLTDGVIDGDGKVLLSGDATGTQKMQLRVGSYAGDLFVRPGSDLQVHFPAPGPGMVRSIGGSTKVDLEFRDIAAQDINALMADLNERLDAFITEDLATDEVAGMQAVDVARKSSPEPNDTIRRPPTLFVTPTWSDVRVDSFELKLRRYYAEIDDPWFEANLTYGIAGLRQGPRAVDSLLYARYLKDRPVHYDVPEYIRFVRSLFADALRTRVMRHHMERLDNALKIAEPDSVKTLFARNALLRNDDRLCELVMIDQLYLDQHGGTLPRHEVLQLLQAVQARSAYPEHRALAANMVWDLNTMRIGSTLPKIGVEDMDGNAVDLDTLLKGATCIVVTAGWCTYCELEMAGLEQLHTEYSGIIPIIAISLDGSRAELDRYLASHPRRDFIWLRATDELLLREELRVRSLPLFLLLNDTTLARSPAPSPSTGLGEVFHKAKVAHESGQRLKVWDD